MFTIERERGPRLEVLAYAPLGHRQLEAAARLHADPALYDGIAWADAVSKPMPELDAGRRVELRVRLCPIVRQRRPDAPGRHDEVDAWIHAQCEKLCGKPAKPTKAFFATLTEVREELQKKRRTDPAATDPRLLDREQVYAAWAVNLLERQAGVIVQRDDGDPPAARVAVEGRRLLRLVRRNRERQATLIPPRRRDDIGDEGKPEALVRATVSITDPAAFRQALARGVGRHRAFGFGMLLVKPAVG